MLYPKGKLQADKKAELPNEFIKEYQKFKDGAYGGMSAYSFAKMLEIGGSTFYKYIKLYEEQ